MQNSVSKSQRRRFSIPTKSEKILSVSLAVFALEAKKGHLGWKDTELEKASKLSRSLIYRYLGSTKKEISENAFEVFINAFYGFTGPEKLNRTNFSKKIGKARKLMETHPNGVVFYQKWRRQHSPKSSIFEKIESQFQNNLGEIFPETSKRNLKLIHASIHGLVTSPFLTSTEAESGAEKLLQIFEETSPKNRL